MSIRWTRTGQIKNSRVMEAIGWSKEITAWAKKKYDVTVETWLDVVGHTNTMRWTAEYPDLATFDKVMSAVQMDAEYWRHIEQAMKSELFIDGVAVDTISKKL